jgi:RNA polymerase-interacting CarD/CdnL/TRCF family regulator
MARARPTSTKRQREFDKKRKRQEKLEKKKNKVIEKEKHFTNMESCKNNIGKQIISLDFGVGVISSVETLNENGEEKYYVINHGSSKTKNLYPVKGSKGMRFLLSKKDLLDLLSLPKWRENILKLFDSKKERIDYLKSALSARSCEEIIKRILELSSLEDLSPVEKKIFDKLVDNLALEAVWVLNIQKHESRNYVLNHLGLC